MKTVATQEFEDIDPIFKLAIAYAVHHSLVSQTQFLRTGGESGQIASPVIMLCTLTVMFFVK